MLDLLLIPAALLLAMGLRAVHGGEHRLHGHLMAAAVTLTGLRVILYPRALTTLHLGLWLATLGLAGTTLLLGRRALAWRESRSTSARGTGIHRVMGTLTLTSLAVTVILWLLRDHR